MLKSKYYNLNLIKGNLGHITGRWLAGPRFKPHCPCFQNLCCYVAFSFPNETARVGVGRKARREGGRRDRNLVLTGSSAELITCFSITLIGGTGGSQKSLHQSSKNNVLLLLHLVAQQSWESIYQLLWKEPCAFKRRTCFDFLRE